MHEFQQEFIEFAIRGQVLRFGDFTLKSGRHSPYFFNMGLFNTGKSIAYLGRCYAETIQRAGIPYDMLFGPAYKGIPLAVGTAIALAERHGHDVPYSFNRKEAKDHGEGGMTVGAALTGKVLIIDDVISAGTSVAESITLIQSAGALAAGVLIALDRQERGLGAISAIREVEQRHGIPVISIVRLDDVEIYLAGQPGMETALARMQAYRAQYGA